MGVPDWLLSLLSSSWTGRPTAPLSAIDDLRYPRSRMQEGAFGDLLEVRDGE